MKIVIQTQIRENYGAHAWDGEGECPQRWKCKGGNTYIVSDVTLEQSQDATFWNEIESLVSSDDDYWNEYVLDSRLVDDVDFVEGDHVAPWESPTYITFEDGEYIGTTTNNDPAGFRKEIVKTVQRKNMIDGHVFYNVFHMEDGSVLNWQECQEYFRKIVEAEKAEELRIAQEAGFETFEDYINDKYELAS